MRPAADGIDGETANCLANMRDLRMARLPWKMLFGVLLVLGCTQCSKAPEEPEPQETKTEDPAALPETQTTESPTRAEPILPIIAPTDLLPARVELGRQLFHDPALSGVQKRVSCATCHPLDQGGTATGAQSRDLPQDRYDIPTVFNVASHFAFYWNGRAQTLESVVQSSIRAENVMDASWNEILPRLRESASYPALFKDAYPGTGVDESSVEDALVTFLTSLATPNAAFDRWLNGESLPERAQQGYQIFKEYGCVRCHQGSGVGGNLYASFAGYLAHKDALTNADNGRFNVTNNEAHRFQFKVPSLRNVAVTGPYFHDGSVERLDDAVELMARYQLGRTLTTGEIDSIVAFLETLTGWYDERLLGAAREQANP